MNGLQKGARGWGPEGWGQGMGQGGGVRGWGKGGGIYIKMKFSTKQVSLLQIRVS